MSGLRSLSTRLALAIAVPLSALLLVATLVETRLARKLLLETAEIAASNLADSATEELQGILRSTRAAIDGLSLSLSGRDGMSTKDADALLRQALDNFPLLFGSTLALDRGEDLSGEAFAPFVFRNGDELESLSLAGDDYRYWERPWFSEPLAANGPVWTDPYLDEGGGGVRMVTYSRPLELAGRRGVLTGDIRLTFLNDIVESNVLDKAGYVIVFDANGRLVGHPEPSWILNRNLADLATELGIPALTEVTGSVARYEETWLRPEDGMHAGVIGGSSDMPGRMFVRPLKEAGWGVAVYFSDDDLLSVVHVATRYKLMFSVFVLLSLTLILVLVARHSLRPLSELAGVTRSIAQGNFSAKIPDQERQDEIGRLSRAFYRMQDHLQHYIADLTQATVERERIQVELDTARQIQQMLLPEDHPESPDLNLVAMLRPARAVGGDLYYYRQQGPDRLLFAIGDVSDKGVPAALFMARAMAVLEAAAVQALAPVEVLQAVNSALVQENDLCMFVTMLVGELSLTDGSCRLSSAGHEHPIRVGRSDAGEISVINGRPVGLESDSQYVESTVQMQPGECLFIYTDGITEARNPGGMLFGDERLLDSLRAGDNETPASVLEQTVRSVDQFVGGAEQSDDITLLILQWLPRQDQGVKEAAGELTFTARTGCHHEVLNALEKILQAARREVGDPGDLELVIEEVLTNVVKYSGLTEQDTALVRWQLLPDELELVFEDSGQPFNPLGEEGTSHEQDDHSEGGMGIMLVRALANEIRYERAGEHNRLVITLRDR
jgi:sigma-B regulation protein RsbU (phosphoserine phosphatase)